MSWRTALSALTAVGLIALIPQGQAAAAGAAQVVVRADQPGPVIQPEIYGQFAEHLGAGIYGGVWVGQNSPIPNVNGYRKDVVDALKAVRIPVVRWPGGCFADEYHWRDGVGPQAKRPVRINNLWGGVTEPNAFGTHEFMNFAEMIGAKTYIAANVGSGSPREMADWVEYMTQDAHSTLADERRANGREKSWNVDFIGVGNETWGCGGNMRAEVYADLYRQFSTFIRPPHGKSIVRVASGSNGEDYHWTEAMMAGAAEHMDALSLHYYTLPLDWKHKGSATKYGEDEWASTLKHALRMDEVITRHSAIMDKYDPKKRVALYVDEWGLWTDAEPGTNPGFLYQLNSQRDALVAAVHFNIFHAHADRVRMANIAQMVNVLQALLLTDGPRMVKTPTYYVFDMYKGFQGATNLPVQVTAPDYVFGDTRLPGVSASAARGTDGVVHVALANLNPNAATEVAVQLPGLKAARVTGTVLTAPTMQTGNDFQHPDAIRPAVFNGARLSGGTLSVALPARAVVVLDLK